MILTAKQEEGLRIAVERYKAREKYTCIAGYAGTGKSTLVKFIISALNVHPDDVCYVAYTGKAATVLQQKGCPNAITAHKLLYYSEQLASGKFVHRPRKSLENNYRVIVVDEVSMLPKAMWDLLLRFRPYVLALGDPQQLPPIEEDQNNGVLDHPHVFLDEVMRQAQESEIIRLSMHVREGKPLSAFNCEGAQVKIFNPNEVSPSMIEWADQVLCATNKKRNEINDLVRKIRGYGEEPVEGDKLISLTNHWEFFSNNGNYPLTNGQIGTLGYNYLETKHVPPFITKKPITYLNAVLEIENDKFEMIPIDYHCLKTGEPILTPRESYLMRKSEQCLIDPPYDFAYAYAITVWKAQGSEWGKVLGFEEKHPIDREQHQKYLYTLITRASDKLVLITK